MKVFVTGASGFIGSALTRLLVSRGHEVSGLVRDEEGAGELRAAGVRPVVADLSDAGALAAAARDAHGVVHLALQLGPQAGALDAAATDALIGALRGTGKAYVGASAAALVGDTGEDTVDETKPLSLDGPNAWRTRNEARVLRAKDEGVRAAAVRPAPMVFGRRGGNMLPKLVADARSTGVGHYVGSGEQAWSTAYIDDVAELFASALERAPAGEAYFAASGAPVRWRDIASAVARAAGGDGRTEAWGPDEARRVMGFFAGLMPLNVRVSNAKARALGWAPRGPDLLAEIPRYADAAAT